MIDIPSNLAALTDAFIRVFSRRKTNFYDIASTSSTPPMREPTFRMPLPSE
jgi:hypothetical protein